MYTMLRDSNAIAARKSLDVMIELYRRNIWQDAKTVNVITTACFSPMTKVCTFYFILFYFLLVGNIRRNENCDTLYIYASKDTSFTQDSPQAFCLNLKHNVTFV